jgi:tungstate transport system substrate-binding protein
VDGDPRQRVEVHAMRSFRVNHPAGKIFVAWMAGPKGRAVVGGQRAYRTPAG